MLDELEGFEVIGEAANGHEALALCAELGPDILLLDIRMPEMDGLETARHLAAADTSPAVIFTTAFDNYAIEAFDAQAVGYLLKPVRREKLLRALGQAARLSRPQLSGLAAAPAAAARRNICVRKTTGLQLIPIENVRYFRADQKYVTVNHAGGEDLIDEPLKELATEFGDRLIRIHRSVLVAADFLERLDRSGSGQYELWLRGIDQPLPVSRRHATEVKLALRRRG